MYSLRQYSDAQIIRRVLHGRREQYGRLVTRYGALAHSVALAQLGNAAEAEDLIQEGFLRAFQNLDKLEDLHKFSSWLIVIVRNLCLDYLKLGARQSEILAEDYVPAAVVEPDFEQRELHAIVRGQIDRLDPANREILLMHYFAHVPVKEIAELLGTSQSAIKKRLQRARESLGRRLLDRMGEVSEQRERNRQRAAKIMAIVGAMPVAWEAAARTAASAGLVQFAKWALASVVLSAAAVIGFWPGPSGKQDRGLAPAPPPRPAAHVESPKHGQLPESEAPSSPLPGAIPPLSISGHVQDSDTSEGIEGVAVGLASRAELDQGRAPWRSVQTDASGKYEFNGLGPGVFAVRVVSARGFARGALPAQSEAVLTEDGAPPTNFLLRRGITVSGRVLDASNQPVPGARVDAAVREGLKPRNTTDTGPEGEFELYGFDAGNVVLLQAYTETALSAPAGPFELAGPLEVTVQLEAPLSISGAVMDGAGRPLADLVVTARPLPEYWFVTQNRAATDGAGAFTLGELWPGRYAFAIADKTKILYQVISPDEIEVRRDAAGPVTVVVEQPHTLRVSGRVLNPAGKGVPDAAIALLLPDGAAQYTTTDAQGAYMLSGVPEGVHLVEVKHPDFVTLHDHSVRAGDTNVVLTLAPAEALTLQVLDAASGSPIPDFLMLLTEQRFDTIWKAPLERMVPVHAPGGSYQIRLPNAAIATVIIKAAGHALHMADLSPHAGLDLTVRLQSGKSIQGRVIDSRGSPVAGARVYVDHIAPPLEQQTALAVTGVDGLFLLDTLSPDVSLISAAAPGLAPGWSRLKEIDVRQDIIIQLDLPGTVAGQVLVGGHPGANLEVLAVYADISLPAGIGARTDAEGRFRISALAPGAVELEFRWPSEVGESDLLGTAPVIVAADQATPVEVSF